MPEKTNRRNLKLVILFDPRDESAASSATTSARKMRARNWTSYDTKASSPSPSIKARIMRRGTRTTARCVGRNSLAHVRKTPPDERWKPRKAALVSLPTIPQTHHPQQLKPKKGGAAWQVKETASRITSYRRKSFSARPALSSYATSGFRLHSSSSESTGRKL